MLKNGAANQPVPSVPQTPGVDLINWEKPSQSDCYAFQARKANQELVLNKKIKIEEDAVEKDKYGRLLAYVWVKKFDQDGSGKNSWIMANDYLIKHGYAKIMTVPPDIKYQKIFQASQQYAKKNHQGIWNPKSCQ